LTHVKVTCTLPQDHRVAMHHHDMAPNRMYWPVSTVACSAWREVDTAMGKVVMFCARLDALHRLGEHEGRIGIQPVAWTDAELSKAGVIAAKILALLKRECEPGDLAPVYRDINPLFGTSARTVRLAYELLERDGVVRREGKRWRVL
jgi:hypothetical protein